jgi:mono/diheme cytochrome c family protein
VPSDFRRLVMSSIIAVIACFGPVRSQAVSEGDARLEARRNEADQVFRKEVAPFLKTYCVKCHGNDRARGGVSISTMMNRPPQDGESHGKWQLARAKVKEHDMPPPSAAKQPTDAERQTSLTGSE